MAMQDLLSDFYTSASGTGVALRELGAAVVLDKHQVGSFVCSALSKTHDLMVGTSWSQKVWKGSFAFCYELIDPNRKVKFAFKALKLVMSYPGITRTHSSPIDLLRAFQL